jgi:hypothetical protein
MSKFNSTKGKEQETIRKIAHPALGEIYCLNEPETRMVLDEIFVDKLYFREGVSILPGDIVFDVGANIGAFTLCAAQHGAEVYAYEPIPTETISASAVKIKCKFNTLSGVMAQENIQSIGLLKLDAELADWEILNGVKTEDWQRIRQISMEVHLESDVAPISQFLSERGFSRVIGKKWRVGTNCVWAIK